MPQTTSPAYNAAVCALITVLLSGYVRAQVIQPPIWVDTLTTSTRVVHPAVSDSVLYDVTDSLRAYDVESRRLLWTGNVAPRTFCQYVPSRSIDEDVVLFSFRKDTVPGDVYVTLFVTGYKDGSIVRSSEWNLNQLAPWNAGSLSVQSISPSGRYVFIHPSAVLDRTTGYCKQLASFEAVSADVMGVTLIGFDETEQWISQNKSWVTSTQAGWRGSKIKLVHSLHPDSLASSSKDYSESSGAMCFSQGGRYLIEGSAVVDVGGWKPIFRYPRHLSGAVLADGRTQVVMDHVAGYWGAVTDLFDRNNRHIQLGGLEEVTWKNGNQHYSLSPKGTLSVLLRGGNIVVHKVRLYPTDSFYVAISPQEDQIAENRPVEFSALMFPMDTFYPVEIKIGEQPIPPRSLVCLDSGTHHIFLRYSRGGAVTSEVESQLYVKPNSRNPSSIWTSKLRGKGLVGFHRDGSRIAVLEEVQPSYTHVLGELFANEIAYVKPPQLENLSEVTYAEWLGYNNIFTLKHQWGLVNYWGHDYKVFQLLKSEIVNLATGEIKFNLYDYSQYFGSQTQDQTRPWLTYSYACKLDEPRINVVFSALSPSKDTSTNILQISEDTVVGSMLCRDASAQAIDAATLRSIHSAENMDLAATWMWLDDNSRCVDIDIQSCAKMTFLRNGSFLLCDSTMIDARSWTSVGTVKLSHDGISIPRTNLYAVYSNKSGSSTNKRFLPDTGIVQFFGIPNGHLQATLPIIGGISLMRTTSDGKKLMLVRRDSVVEILDLEVIFSDLGLSYSQISDDDEPIVKTTSSIRVHPNPAVSFVQFKSDELIGELTIFTSDGRTIASFDIPRSRQYVWNLRTSSGARVNAGAYAFRIMNPTTNRVISGMFIIGPE